MLVRAKDLRRLYDQKGPKWTKHHIHESIEKGDLSPHDFSLRDMAEHLIPSGHEFVSEMARAYRTQTVLEDVASVDTSAFSSITGQLLFSTMMEAMKLDELIGDRLVGPMPSNIQGKELVPGISMATDEFDAPVPEGIDYPLVGLSEDFVEIPAATKHGGILGITREMIIADRTGFLIERAQGISEALAIRREKAILDVAWETMPD